MSISDIRLYIQLSTYKISAMKSVSQMICVILQKYFQLNFPNCALPPLSNYFLSQSTSQAGQASTIQSWAGQGGTRQRQAGEKEGGHSKDTLLCCRGHGKMKTGEKKKGRLRSEISALLWPSLLPWSRPQSQIAMCHVLLVSELSIIFSPHSKY